jgi:putative tryptophan/tyrosine transport system substrate-binding protein
VAARFFVIFLVIVGGAARVDAEGAPRVPLIGILNYAGAQDVRVTQFLEALGKLGYMEEKKVIIHQEHADGVLERLPDLAGKLVRSNVDVIIALGPAVWAAKRATSTIPIVIAFSGDPVGQGVVESLARPGGNLTGFSYMSSDLAGKRLEFLCTAFDHCARVGVLYNPGEPATTREMEQTEIAAKQVGVKLEALAARTPTDLDVAFAQATRANVQGLLVFTHGFAVLNSALIIEAAARFRLPVMYGWREFVDQGGLMSYGPEIGSLVLGAAQYVDRILKGEKPSELPVQQPSRLQLVLNLKTAKHLGLAISPTLQARADEVIE